MSPAARARPPSDRAVLAAAGRGTGEPLLSHQSTSPRCIAARRLTLEAEPVAEAEAATRLRRHDCRGSGPRPRPRRRAASGCSSSNAQGAPALVPTGGARSRRWTMSWSRRRTRTGRGAVRRAARARHGARPSHPDWGRLMFFPLRRPHRRGGRTGPAKRRRTHRTDCEGMSWRVADIAQHARSWRPAVSTVSDVRTGRKPGTRVMTVRSGTCGDPDAAGAAVGEAVVVAPSPRSLRGRDERSSLIEGRR
jgi:hypothetical protein